jgi:tRNA(fMet)-specific endonuclease VapC
MILLDTDHVSVLSFPTSHRCQLLYARLASVPPTELGITIVTVEEQMRGWMNAIAKERQPRRQINAYRELAGLFKFFAKFTIVQFDAAAADQLDTLGGIHIGLMDKKIASIALATRSLLLTANTSDFKQVPGLTIDNWMD